jgi:excisionase family DNA binding protein
VPEADDFMTVAEIAELLKLNQQTVSNGIDAGKLPALHVGRRVRIRRADFDALIEDSVIRSEPQPAPPSIWDGVVAPPVVA